MRLAKDKIIKCYYCGNVVEMSNQLAEKKIPMATKAGVRNYRRQFHLDCLPKYVEGLEDKALLKGENSDWDAVYKYFRKEILGLPETVPLEAHATKRLLGLRLGQYYPQGNNTRVLPRGYDFKVILLTLKVVKARVHVYMATANFANNKHRIDGIMRFVTGEINDVYKRLENQKKSNEKLNKDVVTETFDYKAKLKEQKRKEEEKKDDITGDIEDLFGGIL
jgi:hypothetical protein